MALTIIELLNNRMASGERLFLSGVAIMAEQDGGGGAYEIAVPGGIMGGLLAQDYVKSIIRVYFTDNGNGRALEVYAHTGECLYTHVFHGNELDAGEEAAAERWACFKAKYNGNARLMNIALVKPEPDGQMIYFASDTKRQSQRLKEYIATGQLPELTWEDLGTPTNAESPFLERRPGRVQRGKKTWH